MELGKRKIKKPKILIIIRTIKELIMEMVYGVQNQMIIKKPILFIFGKLYYLFYVLVIIPKNIKYARVKFFS